MYNKKVYLCTYIPSYTHLLSFTFSLFFVFFFALISLISVYWVVLCVKTNQTLEFHQHSHFPQPKPKPTPNPTYYPRGR